MWEVGKQSIGRLGRVLAMLVQWCRIYGSHPGQNVLPANAQKPAIGIMSLDRLEEKEKVVL